MQNLPIILSSLVIVLLSSLKGVSNKAEEKTLHIKTIDSKTFKTVKAQIDVYYDNDFAREFSQTTETGEFNVSLNKIGWYLLSISAKGYLEARDTLWVVSSSTKVVDKTIMLTPIEVGMAIEIPNIKFNPGQKELTKESFAELDKILILFKRNNHIYFEIIGYTDNIGAPASNQELSFARAQTVVDYLVTHGVPISQVRPVGKGEENPIDTNNTAEGRAKNRRVEFKVMSVKAE